MRRSNPGSLRGGRLDCFASLAMTRGGGLDQANSAMRGATTRHSPARLAIRASPTTLSSTAPHSGTPPHVRPVLPDQAARPDLEEPPRGVADVPIFGP
ncbi:hypothetical protein C7U89_24885 [Bradyrhizobium sp. WBOS4]|nr:hypothetical protein [Bradyrhizobium sp. WBOS4]UUO45849.1 hypothetical protein DCM78_02220 [Bradyrhizobium sp. WBOS04]UUO59552.1 hypothetical protein DCM80_10450 [Bradyrhizobium sp. WBOS08]